MDNSPDAQNNLRLIACPRPFSIDRIDKAVPHGATLAEMLRDIGLNGDVHARVFIDDQLISQAFWECTRPKPGHTVTVRVVPTGGGGGSGKNVLRIVAIIGIMALAIYAGPAAAGLLGLSTTLATGATALTTTGLIVSAAVTGAVSIAGSLLVNARIPPPKPGLLTHGAQS